MERRFLFKNNTLIDSFDRPRLHHFPVHYLPNLPTSISPCKYQRSSRYQWFSDICPLKWFGKVLIKVFNEGSDSLDEIGREIRIAHYPPYCSKYNPIEHRFFPHVTRACQGVVFKSIDVVQQLMEQTSTTKGLKAFAYLIDKVYQTGRKVASDFKDTIRAFKVKN